MIESMYLICDCIIHINVTLTLIAGCVCVCVCVCVHSKMAPRPKGVQIYIPLIVIVSNGGNRPPCKAVIDKENRVASAFLFNSLFLAPSLFLSISHCFYLSYT